MDGRMTCGFEQAARLLAWLAILALAVVLFGCVTVRPSEVPPMPTVDVLLDVETNWALTVLRDPSGAEFRGRTVPVPGYVVGPFQTRGAVGWTWTCAVNARNAFGAFVGFRRVRFIVLSDGSWRAAPEGPGTYLQIREAHLGGL